jgi:putative N6-adenine-specific DNA methylase
MTAPGVEGILARELKSIGLRIGASVAGGVEVSGSIADLQRANLWSRVANRIVVRVDEFHASSFHELERRAKKIEWQRYFAPGTNVRFRVTCRKSRLYHSDAVAERFGAAVERSGGKFITTTGDDEGEGSADDAQLFIVRIVDDLCTVSADSSGELLHRRGYRQAIAKAPLRETLAAAMLLGSDWDGSAPLVDPMCGSGTIAIEGAMIARNLAPGIVRKFAFESWPGHDAAAWSAIRDSAREAGKEHAGAPILASDRDAGAVASTIANAERAGVSSDIEVSEQPISAITLPPGPGWLVSNPPYGLRVGESGSLRNLYAQIGKILRERGKGYLLVLLSADKTLDAQVKIRLREIIRTNNGGIPVRLVAGRSE